MYVPTGSLGVVLSTAHLDPLWALYLYTLTAWAICTHTHLPPQTHPPTTGTPTTDTPTHYRHVHPLQTHPPTYHSGAVGDPLELHLLQALTEACSLQCTLHLPSGEQVGGEGEGGEPEAVEGGGKHRWVRTYIHLCISTHVRT